jgi:hypothetical protein
LSRYAPENKSARKMSVENLTTMLKMKPGPMHKLKTIR